MLFEAVRLEFVAPEPPLLEVEVELEFEVLPERFDAGDFFIVYLLCCFFSNGFRCNANDIQSHLLQIRLGCRNYS